MERVRTCLHEDLPKTDIDYPALMQKYAREIGPLLYHLENRGSNLSDAIRLSFFGEEAKECFNALVEEYIFLVRFGGDPLADEIN